VFTPLVFFFSIGMGMMFIQFPQISFTKNTLGLWRVFNLAKKYGDERGYLGIISSKIR
jgi:hypothetical protein